MQIKKLEQKSRELINKLFTFMLITVLIIGNVSIVFADQDDLSNYYLLDYLQSDLNSGETYINTGVKMFQTNNWKTEISFNLYSNRNYNSFFGIDGTNPTYWEAWSDSIGSWKGRFNNNSLNSSMSLSPNVDYIITVDNTGSNLLYYLNGTLTDTKSKVNNTNSSNLLYLHRRDGDFLRGKIYYIKIWQDGSLVRDFVPVERRSDGALGFFDKVNNVFYPNAGSGSFISGNRLRYTITTAVDPVNSGTVSGAGNYLPYSTQTLTATAATGYIFSRWSDGNTSNPRTITVTQDETYTAIFSPVSTTYTVLVSANPVGSGSVAGGGTYQSGSNITITATPNTGYEFVNWNDGSTSNPRTVTVNSDITLVANFQLVPDDKILISTSVNPSGSGYVTGGGYYDENESVTLEAIPNTGYIFVDWSDGETDNPRNITVDEEATYIANFELENPPQPVENDSMTLLMLIVTFLLFLFIDRGGVYNG